jgi:4-hydroxybenzoate polyprenyltransferase
VDSDLHPANTLLAFLRCASCRFAALYYVPFYAGLTQAGHGTMGLALLAAVFWIIYSLSIEVTNRITDRAEDAINRPERTGLCARVGWQRLRRLEIAGWSAVGVLDILWLYLNPNALLAVLLVGGLAFGIGYSRGPRLARSRYIGFVVLNLVFGGVFLLGWAAGASFTEPTGPPWHELAEFAPLAVVVGLFVVTLAGIKDITDRRGDLSVGYRSPFVDMLDRRQSMWLMGLAATPFVLICGFAVTGLLPLRLLALLAFAPLSALLVEAVLRADNAQARLVVRELFYRYWFVFSSVALLTFIPQLALLYATAAALLYWVIATRWLHWTQPVTLADIKRLVRTTTIRRSLRAAPPTPWRP